MPGGRPRGDKSPKNNHSIRFEDEDWKRLEDIHAADREERPSVSVRRALALYFRYLDGELEEKKEKRGKKSQG